MHATAHTTETLVTDAARTAHQHQLKQHRVPPPVSLHSVANAQPFMLDSSPHLLFVRVQDGMPTDEVMPVVVIASGSGDHADLGKVIGLSPQTTVRPVNVVSALKVRWAV